MSRLFSTIFPDYFDDYAPEIEAKGYFADLTVEAEGVRYRPLFYDTARLLQECEDRLRSGHAFSERNLIVLASVTRRHMEAAVNELAGGGFETLMPEPG